METTALLESVENILFGNPRATDWPSVRAYLLGLGYRVPADADAVMWCGEVIDCCVERSGYETVLALATASGYSRTLRAMDVDHLAGYGESK